MGRGSLCCNRAMGHARHIIESSDTLQRPVHEWYVLAYGSVTTCGQHSFRPGDKEVPAVDPASKEWYNYSAVEPDLRCDVLTGRRCAVLYCESDASSYHTRIGEWAILVDMSPEDVNALADEDMHLPRWEGERLGVYDLKKAAGGHVDSGGYAASLEMYAEFAYTTAEDIEKIMQSRKHLPVFDARPDDFRREGESSEEWWQRQVTGVISRDWVRKKDGD